MSDILTNLSVQGSLSAVGTISQNGTNVSLSGHTHTKSEVGLANVDNTSDANKPVSTAQQTALDLKAPLAAPSFTGTVSSTGPIVADTTVRIHRGATVATNSIGVGSGSLNAQTSGDANVAVGVNAGTLITTGGNNTLYGNNAGTKIVGNSHNTLIGQAAGQYTTGTGNTSIGHNSLTGVNGSTTGNYNTGVGYQSLKNITGGSYNTCFGTESGSSITSGGLNTLIGYNTGTAITTGSYSVAVGYSALSSVNGTDNVAVGLSALGGAVGATAFSSVAVGSAALAVVTTGGRNIAVGASAGSSLTTADDCTFVGWLAGGTINGTGNIGIGRQALSGGTGATGTYNTAVGYQALLRITSGTNNVAVGGASANITTGSYNISLGASALAAATTANFNVAIGLNAMGASATNSSDNVAVGREALKGAVSSTPQNSVAIGTQALTAITTGGNNVAVGFGSGADVTTGGTNTLIGYNTGRGITTGSYNTIIGAGVTGLSTSLANNIILADGQGNIRLQINGSTLATLNTPLTVVGNIAATNLSGTNTGDQSTITGNAGTATALQTARTINGVSFNGTANITINAVDSTARIASTEKGAANGVATLGADSKIPTSQLPALALTDVYVVATQVAQLALAAEEGDVAVRTDLNKSFIHNGGVAGTMADWQELLTPTDTVTSVNGYTGAVTLTKTDVGLGSAENKSSATIRGELTSSNVTTALTYTPTSVTGLTGAQTVAAFKTGLTLVKADVGLANVDNTSDVNKPVSTATQTALDGKAALSHSHSDVVAAGASGYMTGSDKTKLDGIATGATANSSNATLLARANHTGTQAIDTILAANTSRFFGRITAAGGAGEELTGTQATTLLDVATTALKGLMSSADKTKLDAITGTNTGDQTITLTGDVTGSGTGSFATAIGSNKVTLGMMAQVATGTFLGRTTAATGNVEALTVSQAKTLLALVKGDVGLGNVDNTSDANKPISTATQTALDNKQALDADLTAIAALVSAADKMPYATGAGTWALADFTAAGRALIDDADAAAQRTTLGLGTVATEASTAIVHTTGAETVAGVKTLSDIPVLAGGGIKFPATQVPSADANTLDDYEEGTFTPDVDFTSGASGVAYTSRSAAYTKVGRLVFVQYAIVLSSKGSSTGVARISLPPGLTATGTYYPKNAVDIVNSLTALSAPTVQALAGTAFCSFKQYSSTSTVDLTNANIANTTSFYFSLVYTV